MNEQEGKKIDPEIAKIMAEIHHIQALTTKVLKAAARDAAQTLNTENRWHMPVVSAGIASGATLAIIAIVKLFL